MIGIQTLVLSLTASTIRSSTASDLGLDVATLRALGLNEGDISDDVDAAGDDGIPSISNILPGNESPDIYFNDVSSDEGVSEDDNWWRDPLAQFEDSDDKDDDIDTFEPEIPETIDDSDEDSFSNELISVSDTEEADLTEDVGDEVMPEESKKCLAEKSIVSNDYDIGKKDKTTSAALEMIVKKSPLNFLLPAISLPQIRNAVGSIVGGSSPVSALVLSVVAGHYAMVHFSKKNLSSKTDSVQDRNSNYLSARKNILAVNKDPNEQSNQSSFRVKVKNMLSKEKAVDPEQPSYDDLLKEIETWKETVRDRDLEKASLIRESDDLAEQVRNSCKR